MLFSVLLPTRNRLEYLKLAIESVLRQDSPDYELVISDNASKEPIGPYVSSLADSRIVYTRCERTVPVTENWNRALQASTGRYIIMLGDDDALLDGYLSRMKELIEQFQQPDLIYTKALIFTYPGVNPALPEGSLLLHGSADFFTGRTDPFVLGHDQAVALVEAAMEFRLRYDFNAQFALVSRRLIDELSSFGPFYQSAFPDYYSMNAAFLKARAIVVDPHPRVVIGVTPKSYGYFHVNRREEEGRELLQSDSAPAPAGTNINVGWLSAATALERGVGRGHHLRVNRRRYRLLQANDVYGRRRAGKASAEEVEQLRRELPPAEAWGYQLSDSAIRLLRRLAPRRAQTRIFSLGQRALGQLPESHSESSAEGYRDILEVCDRWSRDEIRFE